MSEGSHLFVQRIDTPEERRRELASGLLEPEARTAPKFFYDAQGSALYEAICALEEYYLPRLETALFDRHQHEIAATLPRETQFVDLGCGDGAKAARWIEALAVRRYIGVDIAEPWLRATLQRGRQRFPSVGFDGVVTDFTRGLALQSVLRPDQPCVFFYPGSSIGNFGPAEAVRLLREIRQHLQSGDRLLIAADAPKERATLVAAYDDALGVTAAFNRNVLRVANRELGGDFEPRAFAHRAVFNETESRIEMHLVAQRPMQVRLGEFGERRFEAGEPIVTEHSYKYKPDRFMSLLAEAGFGDVRHWSDERRGYGIYVASPTIPAR
ncbi:MAG: L-histidine N(alpha)-methyltransferase [Pseudomonadota bacterium]